MSTTSDTEGSNIESPLSQMESPYSSPSQQVPQLACSMTELRCSEKFTSCINMHPENGRCFLRIIEEPQKHFRFRYRSEMVGTHGCLLGESYGTNKSKTHPTVELVNYSGRAIIRCRIAQEKTSEEHPHRLLEEEQDNDVSYEVPEHGSYKVGFAGLGIIHTAKKAVPSLLYKKYSEKLGDRFNQKDIRARCESEAKEINLNIVRLRFSAHDALTDKEVCPPVFSKPIHNMKSAATNDLRITRMSRSYGRATGGEDVFLLVEKVNKKNIRVRMFELNEAGEETWSANGHFIQSDVHHQYAIVFRTPPYDDPQTTVDKKVYIELMRPTDGRTSEPKEFTYKALSTFRGLGKRKKSCSSYSSFGSSGGSLRSNGEIPATVLFMNQMNNDQPEEPIHDVQMCTIPQIPIIPQASPSSSSDLGEAILYGMRAEGSPAAGGRYDSPMLPQGVAEPPDLQLNSAELERILRDNPSIPADEKERFCKADWSEYLKFFTDSLNEENNTTYSMEIIRSMMIADSGRGIKQEEATTSKSIKKTPKEEKIEITVDTDVVTKETTEYTAFYTAEHGAEVKKLVKELCEMIRDKTGIKKTIVKAKLEKLFQMRLSNGDTFLHMTLCSKQPSLDYIVKLIHSMKMTHLLNLTNDQTQTILHLAIVNDMATIVPFLVSKGCNPMIEDNDGNNAIHYAVMYQSCLDPLLDALKACGVDHKLNAQNNEKQTALHLAVVCKSVSAVQSLLKRGASYSTRDADGRAPLHLAAVDDHSGVVAALLDAVLPSEIDAVDERGYTALQIVCDGEIRENTLQVLKLLLEHEADPLYHSEGMPSAWALARHKPALRDVMRAHVAPHALLLEDDVKSEPEDEFESADEGEAALGSQADVSQYLVPVAELLDDGAWMALCKRAGAAPLLGWLGRDPSPGASLLLHLQECGLTTEELVCALEHIGQTEAANIVRPYIQ